MIKKSTYLNSKLICIYERSQLKLSRYVTLIIFFKHTRIIFLFITIFITIIVVICKLCNLMIDHKFIVKLVTYSQNMAEKCISTANFKK